MKLHEQKPSKSFGDNQRQWNCEPRDTRVEAADLLPLLFLLFLVLRRFIGVILITRLGLQYSIDFLGRTMTMTKREVNLYQDFSLMTDTSVKVYFTTTDETSCHFF